MLAVVEEMLTTWVPGLMPPAKTKFEYDVGTNSNVV